MYFNKNILLVLLLVATQCLFAQKLKFTSDTAFVNELNNYLPAPEKDAVNQTQTKFIALWNSGQLNLKQKENIILISNQLVKKRAKPIPHFENYLKILLSIVESPNRTSEFASWLRFLEFLTKKEDINNIAINKVFENLIFLNDSASFYQSAAVLWKNTNNGYKLIFAEGEEPRMFFNKTNLVCYSKRDSSVIYNTSGYYFPMADKWIGQGGEVTWERGGVSKDSVYAKLNYYKINFKLPEYRADSVEFVSKKYLRNKLLGKLEEKVLANATGTKAIYPRFESYDKRVDLKQVVPGIDYSGGFSMYGNKFIGNGDSLHKAELFIYKKNDLFARASSKTFVFDNENLLGDNTQVTVYIDNDSIGHPGLYFNYLVKSRKLALNRSGTGAFRCKFYDTYHKLDVDASEISFNLDDSLILFKSPPASTYRKVIFESRNFFSKENYSEIGLIDVRHPLEVIKDMCGVAGEPFTVAHLSSNLNKAESHCVSMLNRLSDFGMVTFDQDNGIAYPLQKLFDYVKSNYGRKDYDAIQIISEPPTGSNAVLNLKDNILTIYGVKPFPLSNNRKVAIIPENSTIRIKKDLEIDFDGKLQAGLARLYGKDMTFNYDSFYVQLMAVDSLTLFFQSEQKNQDSVYQYSLIKSTVDSITGLLRIDEPTNKSGVKTFPTFPVFESHKKSYVFYDLKSEKDTVYKKENFFFENYPFEIDSLNTITRNNIRIKGTFKSGGVFPDFEEDLLVQSDSSLGFVHTLGDSGIVIYDGLGIYNNTISLNNSGLKGDGKVSYLNTDLYSAQFDFFPDSMNTFARRMEMKKQDTDSLKTRYPQAWSDSVFVHWEPHRDRMIATTIKDPINLFEEKAKFTGEFTLKPARLTGKGALNFIDANLKSDSYTFFDESFTADTADFRLQPVPGEESPLLTYNVNADVNFDNKLGMFKSNGGNSYMDFPVNRYRCYMNYFSWHMGINQIDIGYLQNLKNDSINNQILIDSTAVNPANEIAENYQVSFTDTSYTAAELAASSKFISTQPGQDSLSFYASSSSYDIKNFVIKAKGVKFINVADAHIFPSSPLTIEREAVIKPIYNARILANRESGYHKFYDATVNIQGAKSYTGAGDYDYIDRLDSLQIIHFNEIFVDNDLQTVANGAIAEKDSFMLGPEFAFYGKTNIKAQRKFIEFEGFTEINSLCDKRMQTYWLEFISPVDPDSILIPIANQPRDNQFRKLQTGMYLTGDTLGAYTSFVSPKRKLNDSPILEAGNLLYFNKKTGYYEILDSTKLKNREKEGNYLSFQRKLCLVIGEGKMELGAKLGQVKVSAAGIVRQNLDAWTTQIEGMLPVDFFFNDQALSEMAIAINQNYELEPVDQVSKDYQRSFIELAGIQRVNQLMQDFSLLGTFETVPSEMKHTLFFSKVKMKWNGDQTAWQSVGKIGVGNLNGLQINKMVNGNIEIKKNKSGDILNIYLEITPKIWFFFTYTRGTLKTISSEDTYNKIIINLKDKERKSPVKDDDNPYMFFPATDQAKINFVNEMKKESEKEKEEKDINLDNDVTTDYDDKNKEEVETESEEESVQMDENNKSTELEMQDLKENEQENNIISNEESNQKEELKKEEIKQNTQNETNKESENLNIENQNKNNPVEENKTKENEKQEENLNINEPAKEEKKVEEEKKKEEELEPENEENKKKYQEEEEEEEEEEETTGGEG